MNEALPDVPEVRFIGLPRLTSGFDLVERLDLPMHFKVHGPLEPMSGGQLSGLAEAISLKGRGGAGFPFAKKLRAVAESAIRKGILPVVVVNGSEDEPASRKDTVLINRAPHLILDGALLTAKALGARTLIIGVTRDSTQSSMEAALAERGLNNRPGSALRARVQRNPVRMVTGESSALIRSANGGPPQPTGRKVRASDRGVGGAPTLLSNAETFAQLGIAARIGPDQYRSAGLNDEPGTIMLTISGAVARPLVIETPTGVPLRHVLQLAGSPPVPQGVLTGGYHGKWLDGVAAQQAIISRASLDAAGGTLGAGAIMPISQQTCPLGEALRVAQWLAAESARQCGPCHLGLPAAALGLEHILNGDGPTTLAAVKQIANTVKQRGACKHPDGSAMFLESTIKAFTDDLASHVLGDGCGRPVEGVLPLVKNSAVPGGPPGQDAADRSPNPRKIYVDWTLCRRHGLCAKIVPEVLGLGPDGFPTVAEASVPRSAEASALRAVRRCPELALRIEDETMRAPVRVNQLAAIRRTWRNIGALRQRR
ncbi:NADH-ubiquinone oxidoreductase-F iron-sulfur binding region domain-containing protein [Streptomyces phaeochromogenes]|uniref:NADH-ubiquinone oxidoreductase-F iron-sulfur binding region domain-containing protein n=1 Tax=Streptomyces phaeochromogenes TaxID=1923 RepID=UPI002DDC77D0|nr:NADH-ubiquinone oxidoreductase-F iron-sulfur binding region domain-containing protein [Streptomyces phaeochromogenes]WRZ28864.1 ferredoxin [Streptomyces phaeochromogenes]